MSETAVRGTFRSIIYYTEHQTCPEPVAAMEIHAHVVCLG